MHEQMSRIRSQLDVLAELATKVQQILLARRTPWQLRAKFYAMTWIVGLLGKWRLIAEFSLDRKTPVFG